LGTPLQPDGIKPFGMGFDFGFQLALPFFNNPPFLFLS
jgi:hypothetical protein